MTIHLLPGWPPLTERPRTQARETSPSSTARCPWGGAPSLGGDLTPLPALLTRVRLLGETDAAHEKETDVSAIEGAGQHRPLSPRRLAVPSPHLKSRATPPTDGNK